MLREYAKRFYNIVMPYLYAKRNYKFFLRSTLNAIDDRARKFAIAANAFSKAIVPILVKPPFGDRMLIIAPHQDDEMIGPGGAALLQVMHGGRLRIVIVQDGSGPEGALGVSREDLIVIREKESNEVARRLGAPPPEFLRYSSTGGSNTMNIAKDLSKVISDYRPDTIFTPFLLDNDIDHHNCSLALSSALEMSRHTALIYGYEVWGLCIANVAVSIDAVIDRKCDLINLYSSQVKNNDYAHCTRGLSMYHSLQFGGRRTRYVERFFEIPALEYVQLSKKLSAI